MIRIAGSVSKGYLAKRLNVAFDREYYLNPRLRQSIDRRCNEYVERELGDWGLFYTESNLGRREWYSTELTLVGGIQPNMIIGMLLGAEFLPRSDADADISHSCLAGRDLDTLPSPAELLEHPLIRRWTTEILELADAPDPLCPVPPFFWDRSGRAAVHGALTTGLKFWGDKFLASPLLDPHWCQRAMDWLTDVSAELVGHFAGVADVHITDIHVGECAACMVDEGTFRQFIVPSVSRLGERFGAVRFHSCGRSDHILAACKTIAKLASLDVGGETSMEMIRSVFGDELPVSIAPLVDDMRAADAGPILQWYARVARENGGGDLTIGYHLEADYCLDSLIALHRAVERDG